MRIKGFLLGVNYWPRHKGVDMWREFDIDQIDAEFAQIKSMGMNTVRIFPLWRDFQPIKKIRSAGGGLKKIVMEYDDNVTPVENPSMLNPVMLDRFRQVLDVAEKHDLKLVVSLMTAWMSGILFDLPWRDEANVFSDPFMIRWQVKYCEKMVSEFKSSPAILAWQYGNEQNCVNPAPDSDASWLWMRTIADVIRLNDPNRPIYSGMHGLAIHPIANAKWPIEDNAEINDALTTHPYPDFTIGCNLDRPTDMRSNMHASAESALYAGLGGKPVLCEETGSLGTSIINEETAGDFIRLRLHSLFANSATGCLWWCYSDFSVGDRYPYKAVQMENDGLGLTAVDGREKPVAKEFAKFAETLSELGIEVLPPTHKKTAIVVADNENDWRPAFNAFILCKQAGIEAEFVYPHKADLSKYKLLICPSIKGHDGYDAANWRGIMECVENGATLYFSSDGASIATPDSAFAIKRMNRTRFPRNSHPTMLAVSDDLRAAELALPAAPDFHSEILEADAEVLAKWENGLPAVLKAERGKGVVIYAGAPIERILGETPYAYDDSEFHNLYEYLKQAANAGQDVEIAGKSVESTLHLLDDGGRLLMVINYSEKTIESEIIDTSAKTAEWRRISGAAEIADAKAILPPLSASIFVA
jgi:endo-1,4-beta-mannosidase